MKKEHVEIRKTRIGGRFTLAAAALTLAGVIITAIWSTHTKVPETRINSPTTTLNVNGGSGGVKGVVINNVVVTTAELKEQLDTILTRGVRPNEAEPVLKIIGLTEKLRTEVDALPPDANESLEAGKRTAEAKRFLEQRLPVACLHGNHLIVTNLLEYGIDPNTKDTNSQAPSITLAVGQHELPESVSSQTRIKIIGALIAKGADINATNAAGQSALFNAVNIQDGFQVRYLLEKGASPKVRTRHETPLQFARAKGYTDIVAIFEEFHVTE